MGGVGRGAVPEKGAGSVGGGGEGTEGSCSRGEGGGLGQHFQKKG